MNLTHHHRKYRDFENGTWIGTCVEGPYRPMFTSWGKILLRASIGMAILALLIKGSLYVF